MYNVDCKFLFLGFKSKNSGTNGKYGRFDDLAQLERRFWSPKFGLLTSAVSDFWRSFHCFVSFSFALLDSFYFCFHYYVPIYVIVQFSICHGYLWIYQINDIRVVYLIKMPTIWTWPLPDWPCMHAALRWANSLNLIFLQFFRTFLRNLNVI